MATYAELATVYRADEWTQLIEKIRVACAIKATAVIDSVTPSTAMLSWAESAIKNPRQAGDNIAFYVVSANASATLAQIYAATDEAVQTNVDSAIDALYGA